MTSNRRIRSRILPAALAAAVVAVPLFAAGSGSTLLPAAGAATSPPATTPPPWEPDAGSVGGLVFYNAAGQVITGGSITDAPLAAYVEGTSTLRNGDTKATLYGYLPIKGELPAAWGGDQLGLSTTYPDVGAPAPVSGLSFPVNTGTSRDESVAGLEADYPNLDTSTDGYAGIYQLRLKTGASGKSLTTQYDSADIEITGNNWSVVYPGAAPNAPSDVTLTTKSGVSTLAWKKPSASSPDVKVTGYSVVPYADGVAQQAVPVGKATKVVLNTLAGLSVGTNYTFGVYATAESDIGFESAQSTAVTIGLVAAPTAPKTKVKTGVLTVSWKAPKATEEPAITSYQLTPYLAGVAQKPVTVTSTSWTATGLTSGGSYTFTVAASNSAGTGPASPKSAPVTAP